VPGRRPPPAPDSDAYLRACFDVAHVPCVPTLFSNHPEVAVILVHSDDSVSPLPRLSAGGLNECVSRYQAQEHRELGGRIEQILLKQQDASPALRGLIHEYTVVLEQCTRPTSHPELGDAWRGALARLLGRHLRAVQPARSSRRHRRAEPRSILGGPHRADGSIDRTRRSVPLGHPIQQRTKDEEMQRRDARSATALRTAS